jgi:hypothetical protein
MLVERDTYKVIYRPQELPLVLRLKSRRKGEAARLARTTVRHIELDFISKKSKEALDTKTNRFVLPAGGAICHHEDHRQGGDLCKTWMYHWNRDRDRYRLLWHSLSLLAVLHKHTLLSLQNIVQDIFPSVNIQAKVCRAATIAAADLMHFLEVTSIL